MLLSKEAAGVVLLAPPAIEVKTTEKSKLSFPAPPIIVVAVTSSKSKSEASAPPSMVEALVDR